jgi:hypothetical protein
VSDDAEWRVFADQMTVVREASRIVRALAAAEPNYHSGTWHVCHLCGASLPVEAAEHEPDCPWRLAVEWVEKEGRE